MISGLVLYAAFIHAVELTDLARVAFDEYADGYDAALTQGLSVSGEDKHYFARGRIA